MELRQFALTYVDIKGCRLCNVMEDKTLVIVVVNYIFILVDLLNASDVYIHPHFVHFDITGKLVVIRMDLRLLGISANTKLQIRQLYLCKDKLKLRLNAIFSSPNSALELILLPRG